MLPALILALVALGITLLRLWSYRAQMLEMVRVLEETPPESNLRLTVRMPGMAPRRLCQAVNQRLEQGRQLRLETQSQVQQMSYEATFPLLLNIAGQPSYFMALKGADGLVKMFAMVNVQQYDVVSTGSTVAECDTNYRQTLAHRGLSAAGEQAPAAGNAQEQEGVVAEIRSAVIGGDTHYYVRMENSLGYLDFNASEVPLAVLLDVRDHIRYTFVLEGAEFPEHGIVPATGFEYIDWDN